MITKTFIGYVILMMICCFLVACDRSMDPIMSMTDMREDDMPETDTQPPDLPPLLTPLEQAQDVMDDVNRVRWGLLDDALMKDFTSFQWEAHHAFANALLMVHDIGKIEEIEENGSTVIVLSPLGSIDFPFQDQLLLIWLYASYAPEIAGVDDIEFDVNSFMGISIDVFLDVFQTLSPIPDVEDIDRESYIRFLMAHDPILTEYLRLYFQYPEEDNADILERFTASMKTGDIGIAYPEFLSQELIPAEE